MVDHKVDDIIKALRGCSKASCANCVYNKPNNGATCVDTLKKDAADALERILRAERDGIMAIEDKLYAIQAYCYGLAECRGCKIMKLCDEGAFKRRHDLIEKAYAIITGTDTRADNVNRPSHYNREGAIQSIDEMIAVFGKEVVAHFCLCNVWKYRYRAADKNGAEDIAKSDWYMRKYMELTEGE